MGIRLVCDDDYRYIVHPQHPFQTNQQEPQPECICHRAPH